jgi:hypothetical protein
MVCWVVVDQRRQSNARLALRFAAWYYDAVNVSIAAAFSDSTTSKLGYNAYPVLATPPILPQNVWKQVRLTTTIIIINSAAAVAHDCRLCVVTCSTTSRPTRW